MNTSFEKIAILDSTYSLIWTDRYNKPGDFEIYTPVDTYLLGVLRTDYYLTIPDTNKAMVIESIEIKTDLETGDKLVVRGRSLESILDRRVVKSPTVIADGTNTDVGLRTLINDAFVTAVDTLRRVSNFSCVATADATITSIPFSGTFYGDNILDVVAGWCLGKNLGFKIVLSSNNILQFSLYNGIDRSYTQTVNPRVVFSPNFDNLKRADYIKAIDAYKNSVWASHYLLLGPVLDPVPYLFTSEFPDTNRPTGLNRRETFLDETSLPLYYENGTTQIPLTDHFNQVKFLANVELFYNRIVEAFDGEADSTQSYGYNTDYYLGDIVQVEDQYGHTGRARITEVIISESTTGKSIYPKFEPV